MRAIRVHEFGGPDVLHLEEVPDLKPGAGQLVVRIRAVGVNPADTYMRTGTYTRKPALPYTPGTDAAGTVESVGSGVTRFKAGDRVYLAGSLTGTYAEQALCEAAHGVSAAGKCIVRTGRGHACSLWHRLPRAFPASAGARRRNCAGSRRERRRGYCRRTACARCRAARNRDGRIGSGQATRLRRKGRITSLTTNRRATLTRRFHSLEDGATT